MSVPYNDDTREAYLARWQARHLFLAMTHHALGHERSMWIQLFTWALADEIYGEHWDYLQRRKT